MKKKVTLFLLIFSTCIIFSYPFFANSHSLESYCTIYNGFKQTALSFLQNGEVLNYLFFNLFNFFKLPYDSLSFVSAFLTDLILAIVIYKLYFKLQDKLSLKGNFKKLMLIISIFLIFYNPFITEILLIDQGFTIALGILFILLATFKLMNDNFKDYLWSLVFILLAILSYKEIICFLPVFLLLINLKEFNSKDNVLEILKKIIIGLLLCILSLIIVKLVFILMKLDFAKSNYLIGDFNSIVNLFGYTNIKYFYLIVIVLIGCIIYQIVKNDNKSYNIFSFIFLTLLVFVLTIFVGTNGKSSLIFGAFPSLLYLFIISKFNFDYKFLYAISIVLVLLGLLNAYYIHQNAMINFKRYKEDIKYIKNIDEQIISYEKKTKKKINKVYFAKDTSVNYYYYFGNPNGSNIRLVTADWAMKCAVPVYTTKKYEYNKMSKNDYNKYFKNKNYDKFDKNELKVVGDKLYVLIY